MEWCVSGPGVHSKLQSHVCWRAIRQTSDVTENGVTASGYGAEDKVWMTVIKLTFSVQHVLSPEKNTAQLCMLEVRRLTVDINEVYKFSRTSDDSDIASKHAKNEF